MGLSTLKIPKEHVLQGESKGLVLQLHDFEQENQNGGPLIPNMQVRNRLTVALTISHTTITKIITEVGRRVTTEAASNKTSFQHQKKKRQPCVVTAVDDFDADAIRRHINNYEL